MKEYKCLVCCVVCADMKQLKQHWRQHSKQKCFKCRECGDSFLNFHHLKRHFMIHTGERPFQCGQCGVPFREQATLRAHLGTHLPRGPFPCELCGEVFSRLNGLTLHKRVHNTNGTYQYIPRRAANLPAARAKNTFITDRVSSKGGFSEGQNLVISDCESAPGREDVEVLDIPDTGSPHMPEGEVTGPPPHVVRDILASGTVMESQARDGRAYLIVLPRLLAQGNWTLRTLSPPDTQTLPPPDTQREAPVCANVGLSKAPVCANVGLSKSKDLEREGCDLVRWNDNMSSTRELSHEFGKESCAGKGTGNLKKKRGILPERSAITEDIKETGSALHKKFKRVRDVKSRVHKCQQCEKIFTTSSGLTIHMRNHTGERPYCCDICHYSFKQLAHLRAHVRTHTGDLPFRCGVCGAAFSQSGRLRSHQRTHNTDTTKRDKTRKPSVIRNFYCKVCDKTFIGTCYKREHMRTHSDDKRYKCNKCTLQFKSQNSLRQHRKKHVRDSWGTCQQCGQQFGSTETLHMHLKASHGKVAGEDTGAAVRPTATVDTHVQGSGRDNNEGCPNSKQCVRSSKVRVIVNCKSKKKEEKHLGRVVSKVHQCGLCMKTFSQRSNLAAHHRTHTGERPYSCPECSRAFKQISHLKDHIKMHTGEKPFRCSQCPAGFPQSSAAKYHISKYHGGRAHVVREPVTVAPESQGEESITVVECPAEGETVVINVGSGMCTFLETQAPGTLGGEVHTTTRPPHTTTLSHTGHIHPLEEKTDKYQLQCDAMRKIFGDQSMTSASSDRGSTSVLTRLWTSEQNSGHQELRPSPGKEGRNGSDLQGVVDGSTCEICGKVFRRKSALKFHEKMSHTKYFEELIEEEDLAEIL